MKTEFRASFIRDLEQIAQQNMRRRISELIQHVETARTLLEVPNLKKLRTGSDYFRIRVGEYRVGILLEGGTVTFVRCLDRKEIYRYFP